MSLFIKICLCVLRILKFVLKINFCVLYQRITWRICIQRRHVAHRWSNGSGLSRIQTTKDSQTHATATHTTESRPKETVQVGAFFVHGESPFHVLFRWSGWSMTYEPLHMTYYALFPFSTPAAPSYCSIEKHRGLLEKKARLLVATCSLR